MNTRLPLFLFFIIEISVLAYIFTTCGSLPAVVASHFNAAGLPNGYMPKNVYLWFMVIVAMGIPCLAAFSMRSISKYPESRINIPNKKVWLSEKYREYTFAYFKAHSLVMASLISVFMAYVHWLVIRANREIPIQLSKESIIGGIIVFVVALIGSGLMLVLRFKRLPKEEE